jgi:hypothetical protein
MLIQRVQPRMGLDENVLQDVLCQIVYINATPDEAQ